MDFWRTVASHGLVFLPPTRVDTATETLEATVRLAVECARFAFASKAAS